MNLDDARFLINLKPPTTMEFVLDRHDLTENMGAALRIIQLSIEFRSP